MYDGQRLDLAETEGGLNGEGGRVLSITPALNIDRDGLRLALDLVCEALS